MTKQKSSMIRVGEHHKAMIERITDKLGIAQAEVVRRGIEMIHDKMFKDYIEVRKAGLRSNLTIEEREEEKIKLQETRDKIRKEKLFEEGKRVCEILEGTHLKDGDWDYCNFKCYEYMNPNYIHQAEMTSSFDELTEDLLNTKWKGGKEKIQEVLERQKLTNKK